MAVPNAKYWKRRFAAVEEMRAKRAQDAFGQISPGFDKAVADIDKEISSWYRRFAANNQISMADAKKLLTSRELEELRWHVDEYIKYGRQNAIDGQWIKQLENASARVHISRLEALKLRVQQAAEKAFGNEVDVVDQMARDVYTNGYYHTAYEIQRGIGIGFRVGTIDEKRLDRILSKPWTADAKTFSDRIWTSKAQLLQSVDTEITRMCLTGKAPDEAIEAISSQMGVSKKQAGRLVMTESAYFGSESQKECFRDLDVERYEIIATLDLKTSKICQEMDGKVFPMDEYQAGVTAPPFHPWCRSCTAPYFEDADDVRIARGADGKTYEVPASMKYPEWKKRFVDGTGDPKDLLQIDPESDKMKMGFPEKMQAIRERTAKSGSATEADLKEAGGLFAEHLKADAEYSDRVRRRDDAEQARTEALHKYESLISEYKVQSAAHADEIKRVEDYDYAQTLVNWGIEPENPYADQKEEIEALRKKLSPIYELEAAKESAYEDFAQKAEDLRKASIEYDEKAPQDVRRILSQIREIGSDGIDVKGHLGNSRSPVAKYVEEAYTYYPKEWVQSSVNLGSLKVKKVQRGYYNGVEIAISSEGRHAFNTSLHELGHRMEKAIPGILDAEREFYARRTDGESLEWLGGGYRREEKTRKDNFLHSYMGKDYGGYAYELVSMGFEYAYSDPVRLLKDKDMAEWIFGILSLL